MSNLKTTNVYYYQLFLNDESLKIDEKEKFLKICDKNILQKKDSYVKIEHSDGHVNLYDFEERHKRYVLGTFVYNQTTNIPPSFTRSSFI